MIDDIVGLRVIAEVQTAPMRWEYPILTIGVMVPGKDEYRMMQTLNPNIESHFESAWRVMGERISRELKDIKRAEEGKS